MMTVRRSEEKSRYLTQPPRDHRVLDVTMESFSTNTPRR